MREIQKLATKYFVMLACPETRDQNFNYNHYIAKSHLPNTALVFRSANNPDSYPDAIIYAIDREKLARSMLPDEQPSLTNDSKLITSGVTSVFK